MDPKEINLQGRLEPRPSLKNLRQGSPEGHLTWEANFKERGEPRPNFDKSFSHRDHLVEGEIAADTSESGAHGGSLGYHADSSSDKEISALQGEPLTNLDTPSLTSSNPSCLRLKLNPKKKRYLVGVQGSEKYWVFRQGDDLNALVLSNEEWRSIKSPFGTPTSSTSSLGSYEEFEDVFEIRDLRSYCVYRSDTGGIQSFPLSHRLERHLTSLRDTDALFDPIIAYNEAQLLRKQASKSRKVTFDLGTTHSNLESSGESTLLSEEVPSSGANPSAEADAIGDSAETGKKKKKKRKKAKKNEEEGRETQFELLGLYMAPPDNVTSLDNMEEDGLDYEPPVAKSTKVKKPTWEMPKPFAKRFRTRNEQVISQEHNPVVIYRHPTPTRIERFIQRSTSIYSFTQKLQRFNPRHKEVQIPQNRIWDSRGESLQSQDDEEQEEIPEEGGDQIKEGEGTEFEVEEGQLDKLYVMTSNDLKLSNGRYVDKFDIIRQRPRVPPPTPRTFEPGAARPDPSKPFQMAQFREEHPDDFIRQQNRHRHFAQDLGLPHSDYHVVGAANTNGSLYEHPDNISDYYGMPLIEDPASHSRESIRITPWTIGDDDTVTLASDESSNYDQEENNFWKPKEQNPSHAMVLYLCGKGKSLRYIRELMRDLDPKFLNNHESRWWKKVRIADLNEFDDEIVDKVLSIAKAPMEDWEKEFDSNGKKWPENYRVIKRRMREKAVEKLCKESVENYFWWRCRGEIAHTTRIR